jgi:hypothetical protein
MFKTAVRQFARTGSRTAGVIPPFSLKQIEAGSRKAIEISKAQGIAERSLVDGLFWYFSYCPS